MNDDLAPASIAVALHYDGESAPQITAKGSGNLAEQIIAIAKQHDVPLQENNELVQLLSQLELGDQIPQELYLAIAEIIAFTYILKGKRPKGFEPDNTEYS